MNAKGKNGVDQRRMKMERENKTKHKNLIIIHGYHVYALQLRERKNHARGVSWLLAIRANRPSFLATARKPG